MKPSDILSRPRGPFVYGKDDCFTLLAEFLAARGDKIVRPSYARGRSWARDYDYICRREGGLAKAYTVLFHAAGWKSELRVSSLQPWDVVLSRGVRDITGQTRREHLLFVDESCACYARSAGTGMLRVQPLAILRIFRKAV